MAYPRCWTKAASRSNNTSYERGSRSLIPAGEMFDESNESVECRFGTNTIVSACLYLRAGGLVANPALIGYVLLELGIAARRDDPKIGCGSVTDDADGGEHDVNRRDIEGPCSDPVRSRSMPGRST
jgi:hypothetical protein